MGGFANKGFSSIGPATDRAAGPLALDIREYRDDDEAAVLNLLDKTLGPGPLGVRPPAFFRWKHLANPFGRSLMLVAEHEGRIAGLRAFMRWGFTASGAPVAAVSAVDTATDPAYQGHGVFTALTRAALEVLHDEADLVFNTPNAKSLAGYLKMGWQEVGRVPVLVRVIRPAALAASLGRGRRGASPPAPHRPVSARSAAEVTRAEAAAIEELLADRATEDRLSTRRDPAYLRWRYGDAPLLDYRAVTEHRDGRLVGIAFFRVRPRGGLWEASVADLIVRPGDVAAGRSLLRRIRRSAGADHLSCLFASGSTARRAALRSGFVRAPGGITLAARPLREGLRPDPLQMGSWAFTLGDLEVF